MRQARGAACNLGRKEERGVGRRATEKKQSKGRKEYGKKEGEQGSWEGWKACGRRERDKN